MAVSESTIAFAWGIPSFTDKIAAEETMRKGPAAGWCSLFERKGSAATQDARNEFAVACIDTRGRVLLATDRFARRPLCCAWRDPILCISPRADEVAGAQGTLDLQSIFSYLYLHVIPTPRTAYRGVYRLSPGHQATLGAEGLEVTAYWRPAFVEDGPHKFPPLRDEFRRLLETAVRDQMNCDSVGSFLSGGTDSSTVSGMIGQIAGQPARTYSIGFDASGYDEMEYARITARHFGTVHHEHYVSPDDVVAAIPQLAAYYDQPFGNSSAVPAYYCARMARADGVTKLLAGDGGDELFGGNSRYAMQQFLELYSYLPDWLRGGLIEPALVRPPALRKIPVLKWAAGYARTAGVPMPDRLETHNLFGMLGFDSILTPEFIGGVDIAEPVRAQRDVYESCQAHTLINRMLAFDWKYTLADNDLPKVSLSAGLAGVSVGYPLLDDRLVDFSLKLPPDYKVRRFALRWFFKRALNDFLPQPVIKKKKHGFGLPFGVWMMRHSALREIATTSLHAFKRRGIVRREFIDDLLERRLAEHPAYYGEMVWILMMLEQWLGSSARRSPQTTLT
jgi:asparagine synthase (glutamine-hydrolysing)